MTLEQLRTRRQELQTLLQQTVVRAEQLRGAVALCDEFIAAVEGNGADVDLADPPERCA